MKLLGNYLAKKNILKPRALDDKTVFYVFKKIIKEEFGNVGIEKFIPDYFKNKTVFIRCDSSAWASELWLTKKKIIRKMNAELGDEALEEIKLKS